MNKEEFAKKLKEFRKAAGLTQQQLSNILGIKRSAYAYYEVGKTSPNLETLTALSKLYNVSIDDLLSVDVPILTDKEQKYINENQIDDSFLDLSDLEKSVIFKIRIMSAKEKKEFIEHLFGMDK